MVPLPDVRSREYKNPGFAHPLFPGNFVFFLFLYRHPADGCFPLEANRVHPATPRTNGSDLLHFINDSLMLAAGNWSDRDTTRVFLTW